jgi:hypothetical protein
MLNRAAPTGPLVISRSSRSTVARYSWANKTVHDCDPVTLVLTPLLHSSHSHTRRTEMSSAAVGDWDERSKPASSQAPSPARAPTDGWTRRRRAASRRRSTCAHCLDLGVATRMSARQRQLPPARRSQLAVCSFYPHNARQAATAMAVLERADASGGSRSPRAAHRSTTTVGSSTPTAARFFPHGGDFSQPAATAPALCTMTDRRWRAPHRARTLARWRWRRHRGPFCRCVHQFYGGGESPLLGLG